MSDSAPVPGDDQPHDDPAGLPQWVKLLAAGAAVVAVVLVVVMVLVGGDHGPGVHGG